MDMVGLENFLNINTVGDKSNVFLWIFGLIIAAIPAMVKAISLYNKVIIESRGIKHKKISLLENYLKKNKDKSSGNIAVIDEVVKNYYFNEATGLNENSEKRISELIKLHEIIKNQVSWVSIKAVRDRIDFDVDGRLILPSQSWLSWLWKHVNLIIMCICAVWLFISLMLSINEVRKILILIITKTSWKEIGFETLGLYLIEGVIFYGFLALFGNDWNKYIVLEKIKKIVDKSVDGARPTVNSDLKG